MDNESPAKQESTSFLNSESKDMSIMNESGPAEEREHVTRMKNRLRENKSVTLKDVREFFWK
jgi:hypothetical protein